MAGPHHYRYDVFLSHSSADKPVVRELAERLKASGLRVWFDSWQIRPGDHISTAIEHGLEHAAVLLFCMSANAFGSDWAQLESHTAIFRDPLNRDRRFVPLRLDDAPIKAMLRGYAYLDWRPRADREAEWGRLLEACGGGEALRDGDGLSSAAQKTSADEELEAPHEGVAVYRNLILPGKPDKSASSTAALSPESAARLAEAPAFAPQSPRALDLFHPGHVLSVCWSPDGERVASGGRDGTVRFWEVGSEEEVAVLEGHQGSVYSVAWSLDGEYLISGGFDETVRLWEVRSGKELVVLEGHRDSVSGVCWSPDGERVASGGHDGTVRFWEVGSEEEVAVLEGHKGAVCSVAWSLDGEYLVSGGLDGTVRLWEARSGKELVVLEGHRDSVLGVCWSPDGERVASGGRDGTVRFWEVGSEEEVAVLEGHKGAVCSVAWSLDGEYLVSGGLDGTVRLWEARSGKELVVLEGHRDSVLGVCWSPDGERVASGGHDGTVRFWEMGSGKELAALKGHRVSVRSVVLRPDGKGLASAGDDGSVRLWEVVSGKELMVLECNKSWIVSVCWSPDGERVAIAGIDGTVLVWEAASGKKSAVFKGHKKPVHRDYEEPVLSVAWSSNGERVATSGADRMVRLWDAVSGKEVAVLKGHKKPVLSVCWSPDGERIASGGDGTVRLWEAAGGKELAVLKGHNGAVSSVCWSPDGERVASGGGDGTVRLWAAAIGKEIAVLEGHKGAVCSVSWSPDGRYLVSGGLDGTVRLWESASGNELEVLDGHRDWVYCVGWNSEGGVWASGRFGLVLFWPANLLAASGDTGSEGPSRTYTNAKVLVVGESGAGKTGLTRRLATGSFAESDASTIGAWCTQWPLPQPAPAGAAAADPQREIWLWDFGGQADQRLIHQLFLDRAALVLLLFNAESDHVIDGLRDWQTALRRSLAEPPPQLLVAARTDAGFGASRSLLQRFASENNCLFLETSARTGAGCPELTAAITETIPWDQLPRHTSPLLFQQLKAAILTLRDQGTTLLTFKDLRERLLRSFPNLDDATLRTVLGLLDGPGVLKQLDFGDFVLLRPEWLGVYGQAVVRALKQADPQLGALPLGAISAAELPFADQPRLEHSEEPLLLAELERQLQERKICLRQGGRLVFPSFCGRERPASPALPPRFMSYAVRGWLDEIHASLVVSLEETRVFQLQELWRDAAEFRTVASAGLSSGRALAVLLHRNNASEGTITVHTAAGLSLTEQAQFAQLIHGHLREAADSVERRRHWLCPHCHAPKGNEEVLMKRLERDGETARVACDACDRSIPLFDDLERLLADPKLRHQAEALAVETPQLTSRRKGKLLQLEVGARLTSANQKWQEISPDEDDGIDLQVEFTDDDGNGTGRFLYLQLKAGPSHLRRRIDGREMFAIKKPRWIRTWTQQPGPVMLVIGREALTLGYEDRMEEQPRQFAEPFDDRSESRAFPDVRWMEISSVLQQQLDSGVRPEEIKQIEFVGETLDMASVLRWRDRIVRDGWRG